MHRFDQEDDMTTNTMNASAELEVVEASPLAIEDVAQVTPFEGVGRCPNTRLTCARKLSI